MKKKRNTTPFIIIIVLVITIVLAFVMSKELDKPKKSKEGLLEIEETLIKEIETIKIENTTNFDLIDIDRELDLL